MKLKERNKSEHSLAYMEGSKNGTEKQNKAFPLLSLKELSRERPYWLAILLFVFVLAVIPYTSNLSAYSQNQTQILLQLNYGNEHGYDLNNDGIENLRGVIDFHINATFDWDVNKSFLATRWDAHSIDNGESTIICYGSLEACNFIELSPYLETWNSPFYLTYGRFGATFNNTVSAQVIYVNNSVDYLNPDLRYSDWQTLDATFLEDLIINETVTNETWINSTENSTNATDTIINTSPSCFIPSPVIAKNNNLTLNLDEYCHDKDDDNLVYSYAAENLQIASENSDNSIITLIPNANFTGTESLILYVSDSKELGIYNITIYVLEEDITKPVCQDIENITLEKNQNKALNLSSYCSDPENRNLHYSYSEIENISIIIDDAAAKIIPEFDFIGNRYTFFIANNSDNYAVTNVVRIDVVEPEIRENLEQLPAEVGKPVKWIKEVSFVTEKENLSIEIPENAFNISIVEVYNNETFDINKTKIKIEENGKIKNLDEHENDVGIELIEKKLGRAYNADEKSRLKNKLDLLKSKRPALSGFSTAFQNSPLENKTMVVINESLKELVIEYETEGPEKIEEQISEAIKRVEVISEMHYENVLVSTDINEANENAIKVFWIINETKVLFENITYIDLNNNGLVDKLEWRIPHLSNQTFEIELNIIDVQSFPTVGGVWTVRFNTTGNANLTISASNGTTYGEKENDDTATISDLGIFELKCDDEVLFNYEDAMINDNAYLITETNEKIKISDTIDNSIKVKSFFIENYSCDNKLGYWSVKVLTPGKHTQRFDFGNLTAYANNYALGGLAFVDNADTDFIQGTLHMTNISGVGPHSNVTLNYTTNTGNMSGGHIIYNTTGNFTSREFDSGQNHTVFDKIAWISSLPNSSDILGEAMDSTNADGDDIGVFYRNGSIGVDNSQGNLNSVIDFTLALYGYTLPADLKADDIIDFSYDNDGSNNIFAFFRNGTVAIAGGMIGIPSGGVSFTTTNMFTIPNDFNTSDIIGMAIDTGSTTSAAFFKNGSYIVASTEGDTLPFRFTTIRAYTITPAGFNTKDAIGVEHDNSQGDMAMFFRNGSYVNNAAQADFSADFAFGAVMPESTFNSGAITGNNLTELTNITLQTRVRNDSTSYSDWSTIYTLPNGSQDLGAANGRYIQYKAIFTTYGKYITPILENVSINYTVDIFGPEVNSSINNTSPKIWETINFTANISDTSGVSFCQFIDNQSNGAKRFHNISLNASDKKCSQNYTIFLIRNNVINFSLIVNDTYNNKNQTDFIITVANSPPTCIAGTLNNTAPRTRDGLNQTGCTYSDADNDAQGTSQYIWFKNNVEMTGETTGRLNLATAGNGDTGDTINASESPFDEIDFGSWINVTTYATVQNTPPQTPIILLPPEGITSNNQPLELNVTFPSDEDDDTLNVFYYIDGIPNQTSLTNTTLNASDGAYILNVSLFDGISNSSNATVNFTIDTKVPAFLARNEINNTLTNPNVNFTFTASDANPYAATLYFNASGVWKANQTFNYSSDLQNFNLTIFNNTFIVWAIIINDTAGNTNTTENFTLRIDNIPPRINASLNNLSADLESTRRVNMTANVSDDIALSFCQFIDNQSLSGGGKNFFNVSVEGTNDQCSQNYTIRLTASNAINFTVIINDSAGNVNQTEQIIEVLVTLETTPPIVNTTFNITGPKMNDIINFTGNLTDETGLFSANITYNISGFLTKVNFSISGLKREISNDAIVNMTRGNVINFTMYASDTSGNTKQNSTLITILDSPIAILMGVNSTYPRINDIINASGNCTELDGDFSHGVISYNISGKPALNSTFDLSSSGLHGNFSQSLIVNLTRGNVINFTFFCNDSLNTIFQDSVLIAVNNTVPQQARILFPLNHSVSGSQPLDLNVTFPADADGDEINISYYLNGVLNQTQLQNTTFNASDGSYILNVSLSDGFSNSSNTSINFTIDTAVPAFSARTPINNSLTGPRVSFNFTATDANPFAATLYFNASGIWKVNQTFNFTSGTLISFNSTIFNNTFIVWAITINDTAGNTNTTENFTLRVDNIHPRINASLNNLSSDIKFGKVVNMTANVSDDIALSFCQFIDNQSLSGGGKNFFNVSVEGTNDQCSQNYTIPFIRGSVINFTVIVNDSFNNINQTQQIITVANTPANTPTILSPQDNIETTSLEILHLNVTFEADPDGDVINISYYTNGRLNQTSLTNTTFNASDGIYFINISLFDNVTGSSPSQNVTVNFTIDNIPPSVKLITPFNHSVENSSTINFDFNASELNTLANCTLIINNLERSVLLTVEKNTSNTISLSLSNGNYNWSVNCTDKAGNKNESVFRNITINAPALLPTSFVDTTDTDFEQGMLHFTNISGIGNEANVTLNYTTNAGNMSGGHIIYNTTGNFTSRVFDTGAPNTILHNLKWSANLPNSSDILGEAMDSANGDDDIGVFYRNGSIGVDNDQLNLNGVIDFSLALYSYTLPADLKADDIIDFSYDHDGSNNIFAFFRNGSVAIAGAMVGIPSTGVPFTTTNMFTIPSDFNTSDIIGIAIDTGSTTSAAFFKNGSYIVASTEGDTLPFRFTTIMAYTITPAGFNIEDAIGVEHDNSQGDMAMFFKNGSYVNNAAQANFGTDFAFDAVMPDSTFNSGAITGNNITESTNITIQTRASNDSLTFTGWSNIYENYTGQLLETTVARFIQYQALFFTPDKYITSYLENVTINYTDTNAPRINFSFPTPDNNSFLKINYFYINASIYDEHSVSRCVLEFNNVNESMLIMRDGRNASCSINKTSLSEGKYGFRAYANDSFGNSNYTHDWNITIDLTSPVLGLLLIDPSVANFTFSNVTVNFTVLDTYLNESFVNVTMPNGSLLDAYKVNFTLTPVNFSMPGNYTILLFANDTAGNSFTTSQILVVNDIAPPNITLVSPTNNSINTTNSIVFNYIPKDDYNVSNCTLILNNQLNMTNQTINESIVNIFNLTRIEDGHYNWSINCTDNYNNINSSEDRFLIVDSTDPIINFTFPTEQNNTFKNQNYVVVNITINETNFANLTFYLYNSAFELINETNISSNQELFSYTLNFTKLVDTNEKYYYNATLRDLANNTNSTRTRVITLDTTDPIINFTFPTEQNNTFRNQNYIVVNITINETNFRNLTFHLYNSSFDLINETNISLSEELSNYSFINFTKLSDTNEQYYYNITIRDMANNTNSTKTRVITLDTTDPIINFTFPTEQNNTFRNQDYILVNITINETNFRNLTFYLYNSAFELINETNITFTEEIFNYSFINFTKLSDTNEQYYYNITIRDMANNTNSTRTRVITLDTTDPIINFTFPTLQNNTYVNQNYVVVNITINETNFANLTFYLYNSLLELINETNISSLPGNFSHTINFTDLADTNELYYYNATLKDGASNFNSTKTRVITLDTLNPGINFSNTTAINDSIFARDYIFVNVTVTDTNTGNLTFYLYNSNLQLVNETNYTAFNGANATINFTELADTEERYYYNATVNDLANNKNSTETRTVVLDLAPPRIDLNFPMNDYNSTLDFINFSWTASDRTDANISCNVTVNSATKAANVSSPTGILANSTGQNLTDGANLWNATCMDELNNTNTSVMRNFTVVNGPPLLNATLADDNETILLDWDNVSYAESYRIYIVDNFTDDFWPVANVSGLSDSNYSDRNAANKTQRFYKIATVKGSVNDTSIKTVGKFEFELINNSDAITDWNLISFPLNITNLELENGSNNGYDLRVKPLYCIKSLWFLNATTEEFKRTDYNGTAWIPSAGSENFTNLVAGRGYWAEVNQTCNLTVVGEVPANNLTVNLSIPPGQSAGWNLVGWHSPNASNLPMTSAPSWSKPEPPYYPLNVNPAGSVNAIDRYNPVTDKFEVTVHFSDDWGWWPSSNNLGFTTLEPTMGYYLDVTQNASWQHKPNTEKG